MVRTTDDLLAKHFNTGLAENNVKIIDPATGTGTFITALIDRIPPAKLKYKYLNELFANETGILPYYVSNLNIEYTYWQKMEAYLEFPNICYTDTLDNSYYAVDAHGQAELINLLTEENAKRLQCQNESKISVVIGNPPYNANQKNYNNQNANRPYPKIDKRIRETFTKESKARKKKYEDMYLRFYRWAMDRLDSKNGGIAAFVSNRSFVDAINTDGFRAVIGKEFDYLYILDTQSDVRKNPKISGTKNNVFGIQTGVAIMFAVKCPHDPQVNPVIQYYTMQDEDTREEKLQFLRHNALNTIPWTRIYPDQHNNWLNISLTDYDSLLPLVVEDDIGIFYQCFPGISTNRTEWLFDFSPKLLNKKVKYFIKTYNKSIAENKMDTSIKWSETLNKNFESGSNTKYSKDYIIFSTFRPFIKKYYYRDSLLSDRFTDNHLNCVDIDNKYIAYSGRGHNHVFSTLASKYLPELHSIENGQCLPLYIKNKSDKQASNITDWALTKFSKHYRDKTITKEDIFYYVYAVFHNPRYKEKYKDALRREHPAIPLYENFKKWASWGKSLMDIHINYETAGEYPVKISVNKNENIKNEFKFDKKANRIIIDDTTITGIPPEALHYKLCIRSALEWIIDQYKIRSLDDKTIMEYFNDYHYSAYKDEIITLIRKIITVSLKTLEIIQEMEAQST
jgi:predicted helicase